MGIHVLPEELWSYIVELLSSTAPSLRNVRDEPSLSLTISSDCPLKNLSLVCAKLRRITLPILFRCARLQIACPTKQYFNEYHTGHASALGVNPLGSQHTSETGWITQLQSRHREFLNFVHSRELAKNIHSFILICDRPAKDTPPALLDQAIYEEQDQSVIDAFWRETLLTPGLRRIVIVASPSDLVKLTKAELDLSNEWAFTDMDLHSLEISNPETGFASKQEAEVSKLTDRKETRPYFASESIVKMRRWQHIHLNEGSFLRGYGCYEYFEHGAPLSILSIKDCFTTEIGSRLAESADLGQKFTYTAVFPFASHVDFTTILKGSEEFDVQLAPTSRSRSFQQQERIGNMDLQDCWWELLEAYHNLADTVRTFDRMSEENFPFLNKITSQDFGISALREELDNACTPMCLPVWAEYLPGVFIRLVKSVRDAGFSGT